MAHSKQYERFTTEDRRYLRTIAKRRWLAVFKRFFISFSLPLICTMAVLIPLNYIIFSAKTGGQKGQDFLLPDSLDDFAFLWLLLPIYIIIAIANLVMFLNSILPLYVDVIRGRKKLIAFNPILYAMLDNYYIQTNVPIQPFIQIDYEQYISVDDSCTYVMEITPTTRIFLRIRPQHVKSI